MIAKILCDRGWANSCSVKRARIYYCPLHAAAPDLLAALTALCGYIHETWPQLTEAGAGGSAGLPAAYRAARAVLARAEGRIE